MDGWTVAAGGSIRRHFASMNAEFHENWQVRKPLVRGKHGIVVSHHRAAAEVGAAVLRDGGNAVDAAIATSFAVSVVEPWMSGIGGGGQMLIYDASEHRVSAVDCGMVAPAGLRVEDYPLGEGEGSDLFTWPPVLEDRNVTGYYSMAVPGLVDGLSLAHQSHATRSWAELLEPAIRLARRGLPVTWLTTLRVNDAAIDLRRFEASRAVYMPDGLPPPTARDGTVRHLPMGQLEATLQRLAKAGARDFYEGELAAKIVADVRAGGGSFDDHDLARYHASKRDAITSTYANVQVNAAPGLTAGPTLLDALSRIERQMPRGQPPGPETYAIWAGALAEAYGATACDSGR